MWWVWYTGGDDTDLVTFDSEAVAKGYQADPTGRMFLGQKVMLRFVFDPLAHKRTKGAPLFTYDGPFLYDGPETQEEAHRRLRAEHRRARIKKALGKTSTEKQLEALEYVAKELEMDREEFEMLVDEERELKEARRRKK
jgi:hypothetical protein